MMKWEAIDSKAELKLGDRVRGAAGYDNDRGLPMCVSSEVGTVVGFNRVRVLVKFDNEPYNEPRAVHPEVLAVHREPAPRDDIDADLLKQAVGISGTTLELGNDWADVTVTLSHEDDGMPVYVALLDGTSAFKQGTLQECTVAALTKLAEFAA